MKNSIKNRENKLLLKVLWQKFGIFRPNKSEERKLKNDRGKLLHNSKQQPSQNKAKITKQTILQNIKNSKGEYKMKKQTADKLGQVHKTPVLTRIAKKTAGSLARLAAKPVVACFLSLCLIMFTAGPAAALTWDVPTINSGDTETLTITVTVDPNTGGQTISNVVSHTQDQTDTNTTTDDLTEDIVVNNAADIVIAKTVDNATPAEGDVVTYTVVVTNNGPAAVENLTVNDIVPAGVTYEATSITGGDTQNDTTPDTGTGLAWTVANLADDGIATFSFQAKVDAGTSGDTITNTATHTQDQTDSNTTADDPSEDIVVANDADIVIAKTVDNATPDENGVVTYTIVVTNNGPAQATNMTVNDIVPAGVTYEATSITGGDAQNDGTPDTGTGLAWTINAINSGANVTLSFQAKVDAGTSGDTITNTATHTQDQVDTNVTTDDPSEDITVNNDADVVIAKTVDNATPEEGDVVTYTVVVTNNGPAQVTNLTVNDLVPAGVTYEAASITGGDAQNDGTPDTGTGLAWTVNAINSGANVTLSFQAKVDAGTSGDTITNVVTHTQDQTDTNVTTDDPSEDITVENDADIVIAKTVDNAAPAEGDVITYTIVITNNGAAQATNMTINDVVPAGVTYEAMSITGGDAQNDATPDSGTGLAWTVNSLDKDSSVTLSFQAKVDAGTSGDTITNTASHTQDQNDSNATADDPSEDIVVANDADIVIKKIVDNATPDENGTITYTITIENKGPAQVTGFQLIDNLPAGVTYDGHTNTSGTVTP